MNLDMDGSAAALVLAVVVRKCDGWIGGFELANGLKRRNIRRERLDQG